MLPNFFPSIVLLNILVFSLGKGLKTLLLILLPLLALSGFNTPAIADFDKADHAH